VADGMRAGALGVRPAMPSPNGGPGAAGGPV